MGEVPCPYQGICPENCEGRPTAESLAQWKMDHPVPDIATLPVSQRRKAKKQKGTNTFMEDTARSQTRDVCINRPKQ